jgi:putative serine protease PepD
MSTRTLDRPSISNGHTAGERLERPSVARGPSRRLLTLVALSAVLLGAGGVTGLLFALGAVGSTSNGASGGSTSSASTSAVPLNASAIYAKAVGGVVAITSSGISSSSGAQVATGTGQVIDTSGDILTASHVIAGASALTVKLQNGTAIKATVLGVDTSTDIAVLHINPAGLTLHPLTLGSAQALAVGDPLAVIGNPFGFNRSLSTGVVSALDRTIPAPSGFSVTHAIQTDAAINPGNSGGPMLNAHGEVVGVVDQIATGGSGADSDTGVGFAIPIEVAKGELTQLEHGVQVTHPYLGANTAPALEADGALVQEVTAGSPAASAGLRTGDLVTAVNGTTVPGPSGFVAAVTARKPGERVTLTVKRGSSTLTLAATLGTQPTQALAG